MTAFAEMVAALAFGFFLGWLLTSIYTHTAISRSQQRMQRIVRYWEGETRRLTAQVEYLSRGPRSGTANPYLGPSGS